VDTEKNYQPLRARRTFRKIESLSVSSVVASYQQDLT